MLFRRYACVKQNDQSDCGPASLAAIALHYKCPMRLQQMRDLAGTDRIGTNLLGMTQAAERLGFMAKAVKGTFEVLPKAPLPAVAHVKTKEGLGHFVVLHRVHKNSVIVADPARGVVKLSAEEFKSTWTGYLILLTPDRAGPKRIGAEPMSPWRRLLGLLTCHLGVLVEAVFCAILMTVLGLSTSYFVQHLVDSVLVRGETRLLNALGIGMVLVVLFRTLFSILRQVLLIHIGRKIDLGLISGYMRHILALPMNFFEMRRVGEIISRVHDAGKVREAVSGTATTAVVDGVIVLFMVAVLWVQDIQLALVATAFVPVLLAAVMLHHPAANRRSRSAMENAAVLSSHLIEDATAVETIKTFGVERMRSEESEEKLVTFVQSQFGLEKLGLSMNSLSLFITALAGVVILWFGGHRVIAGALTIGQLMFFYTLLGYLLEPLVRLASVNFQIQDALVAVDRLYQVLDMELEQPRSNEKLAFAGVKDAIELRDVSFQYGCRTRVLDKLDLDIPAGKTVAVVGESGSGKSTLLKLLMGFYTPTSGRVLADGVDQREFDLNSWRNRIGLVSQDAFVFNGTIRDNIGLGRPNAGLPEVIAAARAAGLEEFITSLPERYETVVGERGANLSGGQRQRLAIARALLRQPDILIFDEATSHLDTATERAIQENLRTALAGKTVILVAHRLSTIRSADLIYVLHKGQVAESGTHRELLNLNGRYAELCKAQTESDGGLMANRPRIGQAADIRRSVYRLQLPEVAS
ncbi:MAG TPA: peptidase domain-containing ABC transporter [Fimbriiglobus sp.]|jgi:ATP-binding cassette subfamily B protein